MHLFKDQYYEAGEGTIKFPALRNVCTRYGMAAACVLLSLGIVSAVAPRWAGRISFPLFLAASWTVACIWRLGPGLATLAATFAIGEYFFILPMHLRRPDDPLDLAELFLYASLGGLGLAGIQHLHRTRDRERQLRSLTSELERTAEEARRAGAALAASREQLDFALEAACMWTWNLDIQRSQFEWSPHYELILGPRRGGFPEKCEQFLAYVYPEDRRLLKVSLARCMEQHKDYEQEYRILWTNGTLHWILAKGKILRDSNDQPVSVSGIMMEITEHKQAEEALRQSEAQLHELADAMPHIVWTARPDGKVEYVNKRWLEYSGLPAEQAYSLEGWKIVTHPEDVQRAMDATQTALRSGQSLQIETRIRQKDKGYRWHLSLGLPVRDESGKIVRWLATTTDIEDQKQTEEDLRRAKEQLAEQSENLKCLVAERTEKLEETVKSLEGLLYHVAHDLRAPLRSMAGFTQILLESAGPRMDSEGRDAANRIVAGANHMDQLILDLLAYGRMGQARVRLGQVSLEEQVKHVLRHLHKEIEAKHAVVEVARPMPAVQADPAILRAVIMHIVNNALTFVAAGVLPRVQIRPEIRQATVRLWIEDNGIGIDEQHRERIFRIFERLHGSNEYSGTGMGLAIVHKGMQLMSGSVGVTSREGQGSRFWLELPAEAGATTQ